MAPGTRRANRSGYVEHDDFEGLPVRQWRHEWVNVAPPVQQEQQQQNDIWAIELLHGMPKDAALLPPHTQELLRAARSGRLYKRPHPVEDDDGDGETVLDKPEKKEDDTSSQGYQIRIWKQLPKNVEAPAISHLAKRRKNTVTVASRTVEEKVTGPTVTRATVRRMDAAGNPYTEEVTLSEGQRVDGEVIATRVEAVTAAQPDAFAAAPPSAVRRRPPPPKRKAKAGPGRGKKKIKQPVLADKPIAGTAPAAGAGAPTAVKTEVKDVVTPVPSELEPRNQDSEMGEADGDDDEEEEEDGDDGDEGEEGDEGDETVDVEVPDESMLDATKDQDEDMVDASHIIDNPDVEMKDEQPAPREPSPPKPPTISAPEVPAVPSKSPSLLPLKHEDTPPRNPVIVPSPSEPSVHAESAIDTAVPVLDTPADDTADSVIAEPPSTIVGEAPQEAIERDLPQAAELPPPEQVGNISSPKDEDGASRVSEETPKGQATSQPETIAKPVLLHQLSAMTEDTIKPEDSVSVTAPLPESEAPSEVGNVSVDGAKEEAAPADTVAVSAAAPETDDPEVSLDNDVTEEKESDLLGGLMGELDRQAAASQLLEQVIKGDTAPATEVKAEESSVEPTLPEAAEPEADAAPPVVAAAGEPIAEPEPPTEPQTELEETEPEPEPESTQEPEAEPEAAPVQAPEEQAAAEATSPVKTEPAAAEEEKGDQPANV
ncbi:hypothetical protein BBK36DRAFT_8152 [Trichoderma citrinoviride]|uniref:Apopolysialoglycoprotein n=1 Tax=Trichoderma citrinoviride TaxID=58853 RepID=A0A2T4AZT4_9HYPO|nr:hypothetical protein BBK36DRAFT_8152 [Trichoderma citrinoviride]PTB62573.1 hypothetical protein BBK36DRAFT_8152 [Trichoderma citrinoviride]